MDWNVIVNWFNEQWVAITSTGAMGLIALKTFVLDKLNLNKNVSGYSALQSTVIAKDSEHTAQLEIIYDEFKKTNVKLDENSVLMKSIIQQNAQIISLNTQVLSLANVPVSAKETFYQNLKTIDGVNLKSLEVLKQSIDIQKIAQDLQSKTTQIITDKINDL